MSKRERRDSTVDSAGAVQREGPEQRKGELP